MTAYAQDLRILVTGSRNYAYPYTLRGVLREAWTQAGRPARVVLVHGACPTGADALADVYARSMGWTVEPHPAAWNELGRAAGPIRNSEMVAAGADVVTAFFQQRKSAGTEDCVRQAHIAGLLVWPVYRDLLTFPVDFSRIGEKYES